MKAFLTGMFLSVFLITNVHAESSQGNDFFQGVLKQDNEDIVFVRCDNPKLKMKIIETDGVNRNAVDAAYHVFNENKDKPLYFTFVGHVGNNSDGGYVFYLTDVYETKLGSSCNLSELLDLN